MFSSLMHRVEEQLSKELPFVVYRKPKQNSVKGIFQHTDALKVLRNMSESGFVFAPFDNAKKSILISVDEQVVAHDFASATVEPLHEIEFDSTQKDAHMQLVSLGIQEIIKERFQKVVLSRKIELSIETDAISLFQRLLATYNNAFCYLWFHPKVGLWLGATPEILLRTDNRHFTTMSLAGTQPFTANEQPSWGEKELQEQVLVTHYIKKVLEGKVTDLKASELETIKAGNLLHLRTKLTGRIGASLDQVINALHPTPAVCGLPKSAAKNFILTHENYDREFYTGFLGELNFKEERQRTANKRNQENQAYKIIKTKSEFFVNLRCMKLKNKTASIYVGGGITGASDPEKEWLETVNKSATMCRILT